MTKRVPILCTFAMFVDHQAIVVLTKVDKGVSFFIDLPFFFHISN